MFGLLRISTGRVNLITHWRTKVFSNRVRSFIDLGKMAASSSSSSTIATAAAGLNGNKRDAPGWGEDGPVCWKCQGTGNKKLVGKRAELAEPVTCPVCFGAGRLAKKKLRKAIKTTNREFLKDYVIPGPACADAAIDVDPETEQVCALLGHWKILQSHRGGHRWSTDDLLTAWVACTEASVAGFDLKAHMDLGCGIGTVLLMTSWFFYERNPIGVGVEAQLVSATKARKSIKLNGVEDRLQVINEDFRNCDESVKAASSAPSFDLVTGTPPYFPVVFDKQTGVAKPGSGGMPTFEQSAPARYEFRGGVEDYLLTASRFVSRPNGLVVVCEGNVAPAPRELDRIQRAADASKLRLVRSVFVHGRDDKPPLFTVHVLAPIESNVERPFAREKFDVRHVGGKRTAQYLAMCTSMGIAPFPESSEGDEAIADKASPPSSPQ